MARPGNVAAAGGQLVDALADLGAHFVEGHVRAVEDELAVDAAAERDLAGVPPLQARQIVARLARVEDVGAHLDHVVEDGLDLAARVLVLLRLGAVGKNCLPSVEAEGLREAQRYAIPSGLWFCTSVLRSSQECLVDSSPGSDDTIHQVFCLADSEGNILVPDRVLPLDIRPRAGRRQAFMLRCMKGGAQVLWK